MTVRYHDQPDSKVSAEASIPFGSDGWTEPVEFHYLKRFNVSVSGLDGSDAGKRTVRLQRSFDNAETWKDVWTTTSSIETVARSPESGLLWRIGCFASDDWGLPTATATHVRIGQW